MYLSSCSVTVSTVKQLLDYFFLFFFTVTSLSIICLTWFSCWCHKQICRTCSSPWRRCLRNLSSCRLLSCSISRRLPIFKQLLWAPWISSGFAFGPSHLNSSMNSVSSWLLFKSASDFSKSSVRIEFYRKKNNVFCNSSSIFQILLEYFSNYLFAYMSGMYFHALHEQVINTYFRRYIF